MTETQFWLGISIPTITALMGIFLNMNGLNRLESRIDNRLIVIEGDLRRFYQILGEHSARLDNLEKS